MTGPAKLAVLIPDMGGGGAERVAIELVRAWAERGHRVDVLLLRREGPLLKQLPDTVQVIDLAAPRIRKALLPLIRYLHHERPDAMQVSMWPLTTLALLARRLARCDTRIVVSDHSTLSRQYAGRGRVMRLWLRRSVRSFYPMADVRVAVSQHAAADLAALGALDPKSIEVIRNPVPKPPAGLLTSHDVEHAWSGARTRILTVGRLSSEKNHALLVRAFAQLRRKRLARLAIVGDGPLRDEIQRVAEAEGVADDVILPGYAANPWPWYASANAFVLSSDYEGYGLVLVEAMACGTPVVSTDCESGPAEILDGGRYGRLVPCGDVEALAEAMAATLVSPIEPGTLRRRAEALSGADSPRRYLELMLGHKATAVQFTPHRGPR